MLLYCCDRSDAETGGGRKQSSLRQRKRLQRVWPSPSDAAMQRMQSEEEETDLLEDRDEQRRSSRGTLDNLLSYLLLP